MRQPSARLYEFLRQHEQLRLTGYLDSAGVPTDGYGHTGPEVKKGRKITNATAEANLLADVSVAVRRLYSVAKADVLESLAQNQYDALVAFVFNLGANKNWTIWKVLNAGNLDNVPVQMQRFVYAKVPGKGSVKVKGLINRRAAEVALWNEHEGEDINLTASHVETPPIAFVQKPMVKSKTWWGGASAAILGGVTTYANQIAEGAKQVQQIAAPQAVNSNVVANIVSVLGVAIVVCGALVMIVRWLDERKKRK